jgi:hypothetical protein
MAQTNETQLQGTAGLGISSFRSRIDNPENSNPQNFLQAPRFNQRFRRDVEAVHALGPFALACLLEQIAAGDDLVATVARYATLDAGFIASLGGDFPPRLHAIDGGRS